MQKYTEQINKLENPTFQQIRKIAIESISHLGKEERKQLWDQLKRGVALLDTSESLSLYIDAFGNMHQAKLQRAYNKLPHDLICKPFEVIDWGCGQAMGTINLLDFLHTKGCQENIRKVTLIEPSKAALERGELHTLAYVKDNVEVILINDFFENVTSEKLINQSHYPQVHLFSNILDVAQINLRHLSKLIDATVIADSYLICVGPLNPTNARIDSFLRYFDEELMDKLYEYDSYSFKEGLMSSYKTCKIRMYKLEQNFEGHLIPIEYFPTVQFQAAYELDIVNSRRKTQRTNFNEKLTHFEVAAPFDLGASVYDDVHPILAVVHNIVSRGLPTKASLFVEEQIAGAFDLTQRKTILGESRYILKKEILLDDLENVFLSHLDKSVEISLSHKLKLQLLLTPIAIARFQKVLIEAIITGKLPLENDTWEIIVEESDVPFAALALKDFEQLFHNLTLLSEDYNNTKLPRIKLSILSNPIFFDSPLHLDEHVRSGASTEWLNREYDLVLTQSVLKSVSESIENFSKFKCRNNCYFNIRTINKRRTERVIYTSNRIQYKNVVKKDSRGNYVEISETKEHLKYFLQLLFRKDDFRPGQLPILDRALKNLPVIGLLPTGGGKSLTYQIAALLQPGVTIVIDPLKSLMKDQYDGLLSNGIDCTAYINSSCTPLERKDKEKQLESSQLLFVFLSPERLSIASFRERLKSMHDYNVYFSYGVIDEVHCVSEWGHDFRFSYLHLGRNLYNYVRAKENEISLFGLTATASFDVLADVERELSGNGSFSLDADAIVRYENTNRLELQYKIEKVSVKFENDQFYDKNKKMPEHLPKAINITNHWPVFDSKSDFLYEYTKKIASHIIELQIEQNINIIKHQYTERQNNNEGVSQDLRVEMPNNYYETKQIYNQAGIVFCPHVNSTGLSVNINSERIKINGIKDVGSFSGADTDDNSMDNLEKFRDNKIPLMVATKAFGMGIDKPNVRFTINMNYSSSLESFVQEAGRAGRDRKIALATILLSDYALVKINSNYQNSTFPLGIIKNKWFLKDDLDTILNYYNLSIPKDQLMFASPSTDIVKLHCSKNNKLFGFNQCQVECSIYKGCQLGKVNPELKGWKTENELILELRTQNLNINRKHFQYLNPDYQTVMYFFNESFKGDIIEKTYMNKLLKQIEVEIQTNDFPIRLEKRTGFLNTLKNKNIGEYVIIYVPYIKDEYLKNVDNHDTSVNRASDISKAIYRMCCIELIEDFTQDYTTSQFRIIAARKSPGEYYNGLLRFLLRYYTIERAKIELQKVKDIKLIDTIDNDIEEEINKCLDYLTEFVYDKISEKRKRAIDDMRNFCIEGLNGKGSWIDANERLKDFIYYYFNSKYAKLDYQSESGEPFSLVEDTEGGKKSSEFILFKYLRVIDDDIVGFGTPLDNIKHLYGAVRLIRRSLTDSNPCLSLINSFCIFYIGTKDNHNLKNELETSYKDGMEEFENRMNDSVEFWNLFDKYNSAISSFADKKQLSHLKNDVMLSIHDIKLKNITNLYLK